MVSTRLMTAQDLWNLGDGEDDFELIRGELVALTPPGTEHGRIMTNCAVLIGGFVKAHRLGRLYTGDVGVVLQRNPDTVLGPDLAFIVQERVPPNEIVYIEEPPDLVVEIVSPSNSRAELERKIAIYLGSGVRNVWIVYPQQRQVIVHAPDETTQIFNDGESLTGGEVLPGLSLKVSELFDD